MRPVILGTLLGTAMIVGSVFGEVAQVYPQIIDVFSVLLWLGFIPAAVVLVLMLPNTQKETP
jgi:hypothetical protein